MRKTYKFQLYPSSKQKRNIEKGLSQACFIYNKLIEKQKELYEKEEGRYSQYDMNSLSKEIKTPNLYSLVKQNISIRINESYKLFFSNIKKKIKSSPPKFKKRIFYQSLTYPQSGYKFEGNRLHLSKLGLIKIKQHREMEGNIKTMTIKLMPTGKYFVFISCDNLETRPNQAKEIVGIDLGIKEFVTLSNGETISYPKFLKKSENKLAKYQRKLSKKKKGSKNKNKAIIKVTKIHEHIVNQRRDFFFKVANYLSNRFSKIAIEKLKIKNMVRNHCLAKSISDNSWGEFKLILDFKMKEKENEMIEVSPNYTSQDCSSCNNRQKMSLDKRTYNCEACGLKIDRDLNASINIKNKLIKQLNSEVGQTFQVFGDNVRQIKPLVEFAVVNELETSEIRC